MDIREARLKGVKVIRPLTNFEDFRGSYVELYNEALYKQNGIHLDFVQDDFSVSSRHVLRGLHGDRSTWKLISCLEGRFYMVVLDWNKDSSQYGQWEAFTLSEENRLQILVPPGFGLGHLVLSERAIFHYKQTTYYDRASQFTLRWDDPRFKIWWPIKAPLLSQRDELAE